MVQPGVRQSDLAAMWPQVRSVRFLEGGVYDDTPLSDTVRLEVAGSSVSELAEFLEVADGSGGACMCLGDFAIELRGAKGRIAVLGYHHGVTVRWNRWSDDAVLRRPEALRSWLAERGFDGPAVRATAAEERATEFRRLSDEWVAAAPAGAGDLARDLVALARSTGAGPDQAMLDELGTAVHAATPDPAGRIAGLLRWFGAGSGRYSGYPVHESAPGLLLLDEPTADVISAVEATPDRAVRLGAVRLWAGWDFRDRRGELSELGPAVVRDLIAAAESTGDQDRISRARTLFGS